LRLSPNMVHRTLSTTKVSFKPQQVEFPKRRVHRILSDQLGSIIYTQEFKQQFLSPLGISNLMDKWANKLSGGESQRLAIVICLGKRREIYLLDEPSANLDVEQRLIVSKLIKRLAMNDKKTIFVIEHDLTMAVYLADRIITFTGKPGIATTASEPLTVEDGINSFLKELNITVKVDPKRHRIKINRFNSSKDKDQKKIGKYYSTVDY
jgi:ATP-binding cassette, sub-family E, member 1